MKKRLIGLMLIVSLVLTACTATDPDNLFETQPDNTVASTPENNEDTTVSAPEDTQSDDEEIMYYTGAYQYGNMQQGGEFMLVGNDVVYAHTYVGKTGYPHSDSFYRYDLIRNEIRPFCKDATCTHGTCVGGTLWYNLEVYEGTLYGLNKDWHVVEVTKEGLKTVVDGEVENFLHYDDKLYAETMDSSLVVFEEGKKEPRILVDEYTGLNAVIFDNYLYSNSNFTNFIRINLTDAEPKEEVIVSNAWGITDGQYIYYVDLKTEFLYRCDMDGSNAQLLIEKPVLNSSVNFDDEYVYFRYVKKMDYELPDDSVVAGMSGITSKEEWEEYEKKIEQRFEAIEKYENERLSGYTDSYDLYRFPKTDATMIEKVATLPHPISNVYTVPGTGKIFIWSYAPLWEERPYYVIGTDGSNPTKLEIPEY